MDSSTRSARHDAIARHLAKNGARVVDVRAHTVVDQAMKSIARLDIVQAHPFLEVTSDN